MINLKIDPEFQSQIPPLTDDEFKQLEENILKEGKLISPLIVWGNTLVDGHNRYEIVQEHPEISFSTMPLPFESREEVLAWICKNQLGRRNLTPEQKKFLIGKQYSVEHRKPGGNGNNQHTAAAKKTAPEELCQFGTIPPTSAEASIRKQIAERNNVSESYVARSEKFMHGVEILEQMVPGMQEKSCPGSSKSVMPICTALPELIFRTASRSCTRFCTRRTALLRSRATHTTLKSTTLRWKLPSGASSRTLIFLCATFPMCPMMPM